MLLQTNEEVYQQLSSMRMHPSEGKMTLVDSVSNAFIGIAVRVEEAILKW